MILKSLKVQNFRNITEEIFNFSPGINVLYGDNAHGKTNTIEAVWLFSAVKSFRAVKEAEMICNQNKSNNKTSAMLTTVFDKNSRENTAEIRIFSDKKRELSVNHVKTQPKEFIGNFNSVLFYPEQLGLIKNGPDGRRKFTDISICQIRPIYYSLLSRFSRVLAQRNALLKSGKRETLEIWDERFAKLSNLITQTRENYISKINEKAKKFLSEISNGKEELEIRYLPSASSQNETYVYEMLQKCHEKDYNLGYTTVGAHKDDFETYINGKNVKIYGSQGQQRSCVVAIKLAEAEVLNDVYGEMPIVLLDDIFSELDQGRREYITEKITNAQVILTACESPQRLTRANLIHINCGKIEQG